MAGQECLAAPATTTQARAMTYPIGVPGVPWGETERAAWRARQRKHRSYEDDVVRPLDRLRSRFDVSEYGRLDCGADGIFALHAVRSRRWDAGLPVLFVTGGVHGYETSGVHGALGFLESHGDSYAGRANLLVAPCVSPWSYERIQRWNPDAVDPNRSFRADGSAPESMALLRLVASTPGRFAMHIDLHETTDTDESEFRPALAARDGQVFQPGAIPDGFYLVDDAAKPEPLFQAAILEAVEKITHIAPADPEGKLIGESVVSRGVVLYACRALGLCAGATDARFTTTTEVYPDSPRVSPAVCNAAQIAAIRAGIEHVLRQGPT
jgi:hypothetical protein